MSNKVPYPVIILCLIVLLPFLEAAPPKEEAPPPISYREVPKYLTTSQIYQWEAALEQRQLGQSQVASGNRLINREPTPLRSAENIKKDKEDGKALVTRGEALIAAAEAELLQLQKIAYANQQKAAPVEIEPTTYSLELAARTLDTAIAEGTEALLFDIWSQGYARIYFGGGFLYKTDDEVPLFLMNGALSKQIRDEIARLDGTRFTFVNEPEIQFYLADIKGVAAIDFPERAQILRNFQSVYIFATLLYDVGEQTAFLAIQGIDLATQELVASEVALIEIDERLGEITDVDEAALATSHATKRIAAEFTDKDNFFVRIQESATTYRFVIDYVGDTSSMAAHMASLLAKELMLEAGIATLNTNLLKATLNYQEEEAMGDFKDHANARLRLTPLNTPRNPKVDYDVEAVSLLRSDPVAVPIGLMQVVRENDLASD